LIVKLKNTGNLLIINAVFLFLILFSLVLLLMQETAIEKYKIVSPYDLI